jgi:hypothetical protein
VKVVNKVILVLFSILLLLTAGCSQDISALVAAETATPTPFAQVVVVTMPEQGAQMKKSSSPLPRKKRQLPAHFKGQSQILPGQQD